MIASGVKLEEYREVKPDWEMRLSDYKRLSAYSEEHYKEIRLKQFFFPHRQPIEDICHVFSRGYTHVRFYRGYSTDQTMTFIVEDIDIGKGNPGWGAPVDRDVFIIKLGERL